MGRADRVRDGRVADPWSLTSLMEIHRALVNESATPSHDGGWSSGAKEVMLPSGRS
jgi:hypothetical protein